VRTEGVAEYASAATAEPLPGHVDRWSRQALLDTLAVLLAGRGTPTAQAAARTALRSPGESTLIGTDLRASASMAAFADATAANALDYEDGHYLGGGIHAGSTVLPTLLALASHDTTLGEFRRALVIGYEIAIRAGWLLTPAHSGRHYRTSGHAASLGAAAAGAALVGLDPESIASAVRIAASHAPVSTVNSAASCESIGWAAATAVTAVQLAQDGFADERGDATMFSPVQPSPFDDDAPPFTGTLGSNFEAPNCYVKPYSCCRVTHAALDGLGALADGGLKLEESDEITVFGIAFTKHMDNRAPRNLEQAQFSIPISIATFAIERELGPDQSHQDRYGSDAVFELAQRVRVEHDPELDGAPDGSYPARVVCRQGRNEDSIEIRDASGSVTNPLDDDERLAKLNRCLVPVGGTAYADSLIDFVSHCSDDVNLLELRAVARHAAGIQKPEQTGVAT
jgi:2-methylcitrate dehydratase PrpD